MENWCVISVDDGEIIRICNTRKEALQEIQDLKWCDGWTGENKKYIAEREDRI